MIYREKNKNKLYSCHEHNEKKRCPVCGSLKTKKHGKIQSGIISERGKIKRSTQRYVCKDCGKAFSSNGYNRRKRFSDEVRLDCVKDYVLTKNSLREVGNRYCVSPMSILNWMPEISTRYPLLPDMLNKMVWSGFITLDGKEISLSGTKRTILTACDGINKIPFLYGIYNSENHESSKAFLERVKKVYPVKIKGITTDFGRGKCFLAPVAEFFEGTPHQICLVHFKRYVWLFLPRTKRSRYYWRNKVLKELINRILDAETYEESQKWLDILNQRKTFFKASYHKRFIRSINRNYTLLTAHYHYRELLKTTNVSECINRQLERKLKNLDGFKSDYNLESFLRIWFSNYFINQTQLS